MRTLIAALASTCAAARVWPRPNLYFGTRNDDVEQPVLTGLAWASATTAHEGLRHSCQHDHKLQRWGWLAHDGCSYGMERIGDASLGVNLNLTYRNLASCSESEQDERWTSTISGVRAGDAPLLSVISYISGTDLHITPVLVHDDAAVAHAVSGRDAKGREFRFTVSATGASTPSLPDSFSLHPGVEQYLTLTPHALYAGVSVAPGDAWRVEVLLQRLLGASARAANVAVAAARMGSTSDAYAGDALPLLNNSMGVKSNLLFIQHILAPPFHLHWQYDTIDQHDVHLSARGEAPRAADTAAVIARFHADLCTRLQLCKEGSSNGTSPVAVAGAAVANLLGGITRFTGKQLVARPGAPPAAAVETTPHTLITGVPSRSFFPRGFLWDEGFHTLITSQWDGSAAQLVLSSWLRTCDVEGTGAGREPGWIAREQILGEEARSRVPQQFQVQRPDIANPPTIFMATLVTAVDALCASDAAAAAAVAVGSDGSISSPSSARSPEQAAFCARHVAGTDCRYACRNGTSAHASARAPASATMAFLREAVPRLVANFGWYVRTQAGQEEHSFRWRGATQDHNFASGFDDAPRGVIPTLSDLNVDLLAWMAMASDVLADLTSLLGDTAAADKYRALSGRYILGLQRHWDDSTGVYCDIGAMSVAPPPEGATGAAVRPQEERAVMGRVCHIGYVTIMPLLLRQVDPRSPQLGRMLAAMASQHILLSKHGLRSLSAGDPLFGTKEDYWRGAVWINMNYMAVAALRHYAAAPGVSAADAAACVKLAKQVKQRVVRTMVAEYDRTGFVWENYDSRDGHGRGTHPFTGWSALLALLVADRYPF